MRHYFFHILFLSLVLGVLFLNCSGNISVNVPGCETCPERCVQDNKGTGRCVACLTDKQCKGPTAPDKRCTPDHKCVCGSDKDCGSSHCDSSTGRCVPCIQDSHCKKSPDRPFCLFQTCKECKPNAIRGCAPTGIQICVKGTQVCKTNGSWDVCKGFKACKQCPGVESCQIGEKKCTTPKSTIPGKYKNCWKDQNDCYTWNDEEQTCKDGEYCEKGQCIPKTCPAPVCSPGETRCAGDSEMEECGRDKDSCVIWTKKACPSGEKCSTKLKKCTSCEPKKETCNRKDDDCDGQIDEDFTGLNKPCEVGKGTCKNKGNTICSNDGTSTTCSATPGKPNIERCNGRDDDCDGSVDNGAKCANGKPCVNGLCGKPEPGCADNTRELFTDMSKFPTVAGCAGYFRGESLRAARSNSSCAGTKNQACPAAEDLCAKGWHICVKSGQVSDLRTRLTANDCATNGPGLFVAASSHCAGSQPTCRYAPLPCMRGGPCSEPLCCGQGCKDGLCKDAVWQNATKCARPKTYIGCGNGNSFHGNPILTGVLCCKD